VWKYLSTGSIGWFDYDRIAEQLQEGRSGAVPGDNHLRVAGETKPDIAEGWIE
jgi:hypothetical protein